MTTWRTRIEPFTRPLFFAWSRISRGMTLGVRGVAINSAGRVLLVKHTYLHGWWLPGGGVERGQTCEDALIRELREEAGVIVEGRPALISVHSNERFFRGEGSGSSGGHGLGLAICQSIMQSHGGDVVHRPTPGGGATFEARFPPVAAPEAGARSHADPV